MSRNMQSNITQRGSFGTDLSNTINNPQIQKESSKPLFATKAIGKKFDLNSENNISVLSAEKACFDASEESNDAADADQEAENTRSISSEDTVQEEFQKLSETLLQQVEESYTNVKRSQNITVSLLQELNNFQETLKSADTDSSRSKEIQDLVALYTEKVNSIIERNNERVSIISNIEDTFHYIQSLQSQCYQNNLFSLQRKLESRETEIDELKQNYQQLELWVLTVFREVISYSKLGNNDFKLSLKDIQKAIRCPSKRSNLEFIYRYLIKYLYAEEEGEEEEDPTKNQN